MLQALKRAEAIAVTRQGGMQTSSVVENRPPMDQKTPVDDNYSLPKAGAERWTSSAGLHDKSAVENAGAGIDDRQITANDDAALMAYLQAMSRLPTVRKYKQALFSVVLDEFEAICKRRLLVPNRLSTKKSRAATTLRVLDVGCGTGFDTRLLANELLSCRSSLAKNSCVDFDIYIDVWGIDIRRSFVEHAEKHFALNCAPSKAESSEKGALSMSDARFLQVCFACFDISDFNALKALIGTEETLADDSSECCGSRSFDIILADRTLQHLPDADEVLKSLVDHMLAPDGLFVSADPDWETLCFCSGASDPFSINLDRLASRAFVDLQRFPRFGSSHTSMFRSSGLKTVFSSANTLLQTCDSDSFLPFEELGASCTHNEVQRGGVQCTDLSASLCASGQQNAFSWSLDTLKKWICLVENAISFGQFSASLCIRITAAWKQPQAGDRSCLPDSGAYDCEIVAASISDVPHIAKLVNDSYSVDEAFFVEGDRTSEADVAKIMASDGCTFLVARGKSTCDSERVAKLDYDPTAWVSAEEVFVPLLGSVLMRSSSQPENHSTHSKSMKHCSFGMLAVDRVMRHRGVARALVAAVEERARLIDARRVDIDVVSLRPELLRFYNSLGYEPIGQTQPWMSVGMYGSLRLPTELILLSRPITSETAYAKLEDKQ